MPKLKLTLKTINSHSLFLKPLFAFVFALALALVGCDTNSGSSTVTPAEPVQPVQPAGPKTYIITFVTNAGGGVFTNQTITEGSNAVRPTPAPVRSGYNFVDWYKENSFNTVFLFDREKISNHLTLYAKWTTKLVVTFDSTGGSELARQEVTSNEKTTKPEDPTRTGFTFKGWFTTAATNVGFDFDTVRIRANTTIYAAWQQNTYTVTFITNVGDPNFAVQRVLHSSNAVKPSTDPTRANFIFGGWHTDTAGTIPFNFSTKTITGNITLYAKWLAAFRTCSALLDPASRVAALRSEPLFNQQWYLENTGQLSGAGVGESLPAGRDLNVLPAWRQGCFGEGMTVGVVDEVVDRVHQDLSNNVKKIVGSYNPSGAHGTAVTGIIAAAANGLGIAGIAPQAEIYSYRSQVAEGVNGDALLTALRMEPQQLAAYNLSIGAGRQGLSYEPLTPELRSAFETVLRDGFGGKGSSLVFAAGNLGSLFSSSVHEPFIQHYGAIPVNGVAGISNRTEHITFTHGPQLWLTTYVLSRVYTTDNSGAGGYNNGDYDPTFSGTSAAAPMVTGAVTLMRQANPQLTWRDVKVILAETARRDWVSSEASWTTGNRRYHNPSESYAYSKKYGFGFLDVGAAVALATNWTLLPSFKHTESQLSADAIKAALPANDADKTIEVSLNLENSEALRFIEFVELELNLAYFRTPASLFGAKVQLKLFAPDGKESLVIRNDRITIGIFDKNITLGVGRFLGAPSAVGGQWRMQIKTDPSQVATKNYVSQVKHWKLKVYGH